MVVVVVEVEEVVEAEVEVEVEEVEEEVEEVVQEVCIQAKYPYLLLTAHNIVRHPPILTYQPDPPRKAK